MSFTSTVEVKLYKFNLCWCNT